MRTAICPTKRHFHDLASHFLALPARDRFLRFGWIASDVDIVAYVEKLLQSIGNVFVVLDPAPGVSGALHLEFAGCGADLGLSVSPSARGKGIGSLLLERAGLVATACGAGTLFVRNLTFNAALQRLARRVGMRVACASGAASTRLELPAARCGRARVGGFAECITLADHSLRSGWSKATADDFAVEAVCEQAPA